MKISSPLTDSALLREFGNRIARTRLDQNLTQQELADTSSVGVSTVKRLEAGGGTTLTNVLRVLRALDLLDALDQAVPESIPSPIQQASLQGRRRKRGSGRRVATGSEKAGEPAPWRWGDEAAS